MVSLYENHRLRKIMSGPNLAEPKQFTFQEDLRKKEEQLRLLEIQKRRSEIIPIIDQIYDSLSEEGLKDEKNAEQEEVFRQLAKESIDLLMEAEEIKKRQIERLKSVLGISGDIK